MRESIGARLKSLRAETGLSARAVGEAVRMSGRYLLEVEADIHEPGLYKSAELAKYYGVSIDYVAGLTDKRRNPYVPHT